MVRWFLLAAVVMLVGCNESPPPSPLAENQKAAAPLPPEVEFDPTTAAAKHKKSGHARR